MKSGKRKQRRNRSRKHSKSSTSTSLWPMLSVVSAVAALTAGLVYWGAFPTAPEDADVIVYKTRTCHCCTKWVTHLRHHDLSVAVVNVRDTHAVQDRLNVPKSLGSCHTAKAGNYFIEGHVPADLVQRLLTEQPENIRGLAVPDMPIGSPGMEGPNSVEYDVLSVDTRDEVTVYATRQGQPAR